MNPDPPTKAMAPRGDDTGWLKQLLHSASRDLKRSSPRTYADAVPGSSDPKRTRRVTYTDAHGGVEHMPAGGPGGVQRWQSEDGTLHRRRREAGPGATLVRVTQLAPNVLHLAAS